MLKIREANADQDANMLTKHNCAMALETEGKVLDVKSAELGVQGLFDRPQFGFYLVAEHSEEVIGALRISYERSVSRNGFFWWIQNVCINENYRGNGIFQKLHDKVVNLAKKNKEVVAIKLHVHTNNRSAIKAYEKAGMKKTPEYPYIFNLK